jgi:hypothetical protein
MVGSASCRLKDFTISKVSSGSRNPAIGLLLGRNESRNSAGLHHFDGFSVTGKFTIACVYNIGSEVNTWDKCGFFTVLDGAASYFTSEWNSKNARTPFGVLSGGTTAGGAGAISNVQQTFFGCNFHLPQSSSGSFNNNAMVHIEMALDYVFLSCFFSGKTNLPTSQTVLNGTVFKLGYDDTGITDPQKKTLQRISIHNCYCETLVVCHSLTNWAAK